MADKAASKKAVDFSNVKDQSAFKTGRVPAGDYRAKIVKVEDGESKKDGEFQYVFTIKLVKFSANAYPYYCKLVENQLWKLRNILVAAGMSVPKKRLTLDPNKIVGKEIGVAMADDEYDGKEKSVIDAVFPASELEDIEDGVEDDGTDEPDVEPEEADDEAEKAEEEPKPKKKKKGKKGKKDKGSDEDLEELDISDIE